MNKRENKRESGWKTFVIGAALLVLIGAWSAFVVWHANKAPIPVPAGSQLGVVTSEVTGEDEVARRIIVYVTNPNGTTEEAIGDAEDQSSAG
ncbi:hypothetical protein [Cohnella herbarum]|uniref:Uncharacterized protein n=1 Tax=Cohnella herbarum TaxID=2728023 RepID=A0A7Z2VP63_9BACL|nr:hypothetical protein [Cohnella herbarum]QJD86943.1 hypothetical protein HH215_29740 [Cohnella herbarum]